MKKVLISIVISIATVCALSAQSTANITIENGETFTIELSKAQTINLIVDKSIKSRKDSNFTYKGVAVATFYDPKSKTYTCTINNTQFAQNSKVGDIRKAVKKELKK